MHNELRCEVFLVQVLAEGYELAFIYKRFNLREPRCYTFVTCPFLSL